MLKKILAIDLGDKKIGLAKTDGLGLGVWPLSVMKRTRFDLDMEQLAEIILSEQIEEIVLGLPLNQDGSEGPRVKKTRAFQATLQKTLRLKHLKIPIILYDERLTSYEADHRLRLLKNKSENDAVAAQILLEDYLERKNS
ncbi:MAG: Holliday junction resolvase RuvX [Deltaproteobacteria bacterium]|nr:Holliday junction resolvase RuvX [Deltaproteobacteria bacterium]